MKNIYLISIVAMSVLVFFNTGCKNKSKEYQPTTTIVEGHITSPPALVIILRGTHEIKGTIDQEGKFFIQTELDKSGIYTLEVGDQKMHVFIVPGDRISLITDYRDPFAGAPFKGSHALENNYLVHFENLKSESEPKDFQKFFSMKEPEFVKAVETRQQVFLDDQQEYQKKNGPFDEIFAELISEELSYDAAILKMNYPEYYEYLMPDSTLVLTDSYESFFQNLEIDRHEQLFVPSFKEFITSYLHFKTASDTNQVDTPLPVRTFDNISTLFTDPELKSLLYYNLMKETIEQSINDASMLVDKYRNAQTNTQYLDEINQLYLTWDHLIKGKTAPGFEYFSIQNKKVSLESLRGKVIYIDVWATWCGPCLRELPALEKLETSFTGSDKIAFVSISLDQDKTAWQTMVKEKNMHGIQLFAEGNWSSTLATDYLIQSIPRFIIIGTDGKILDANAPRPSEEKIYAILKTASES
ncbi:MAG: TlpA family protein disulfide reductase [Saprospiraceae bacterium]|nr:TlpA family protein disulfide reductase [Saprospiraceae bacterium]